MRNLCLTFILVLTIIFVVVSRRPSPGAVLGQWKNGNGIFDVRITAYREKNGGFVRGAYYEFASTASGQTDWHKIMVFRHDDPIPIPRNQTVFLSSKVAYVFMGWMYAVTTDGGHTWSAWSAERDLTGWKCCNYALIREVRIHASGVGRMVLNPIPNRPGEVPALFTKDYGRHWSVDQ